MADGKKIGQYRHTLNANPKQHAELLRVFGETGLLDANGEPIAGAFAKLVCAKLGLTMPAQPHKTNRKRKDIAS